MTFRLRTAVVVLALTGLTMGLAFAVVWERFVAAQRHQLDEALLSVARREAAEAAAGQLEFSDAPGPSANAVGPLPKLGVFYGPEGGALSVTPGFDPPPLPRARSFDSCFDFDHGGLPLRGVVVLVPGSARRLLLATSRADLEDDARILRNAMTVAFLVGCLWAALVAFTVATRLTRNHRAIEYVARRVVAGDTSARVAFRSNDVDLRQLALDLNAMIDRLVSLLASQERFVANAAHELRTPLTSLRIELEDALRGAAGPERYAAAIRGALESTDRLISLAEDLLSLARAKSPHGEEAEVTDCIADAVADVAPLARQRDVAIRAEPTRARARGSRREVARVLRNLVENAVRFSPEGSTVQVSCATVNDDVEITVIDEGPGVAAEEAVTIFEPFNRRRGEIAEGTGLGLAIARDLARSFGGDVAVTAGPPGRFTLRLPRSGSAAR